MKRNKNKFLLILAIVLPLLAIGAVIGYREYKTLRHANLIKKARQFLAEGKLKKAVLYGELALRYDASDIDACRLMADLDDAAHAPAALFWRSRVVKLDPNSLSDQLALCDTALKWQNLVIASNSLAAVSDADKKTAAYQNMAGATSAKEGRMADAESHFLEGIRLDPGNPSLQLSLAVIRLHGPNAAAKAEARNILAGLSVNTTNADVRVRALRERTIDTLDRGENSDALALSKQLAGEKTAAFTDRLLRLEVLRQTKSPDMAAEFTAASHDAVQNPGDVYELGLWQMLKFSPATALKWMQSLPPNVQTNQSVAMLMAECQTSIGDWTGLSTALEHQNWAELDFLRHAFLARALRGQQLTDASHNQWTQALQGSGDAMENLTMLLRLAAEWKWISEGEDVLWAVVNNYPDEKWAFHALSKDLFDNGRTRSLMALYSQEAKRSPADVETKNNLAMTALLLEADEMKPNELARDAYTASPTNPSYASTYAYSLHLQKRDSDALKVFETLRPEDLSQPGVAGYYGIILEATGNRAKAVKYLNMGSSAPALPEERRLFATAAGGA